MATITLTDDNFESEVINSDVPVLVDVWATWCGPCRMLTPVIEQLAQKYEGKAKVGKLNSDDNPTTAGSLGVSALPTVLIFQGGEVRERMVGLQSEQRLAASLDAVLG